MTNRPIFLFHGAIATYLLERSAYYGLFYFLAGALAGERHYGVLVSALALVEPLVMLLFGKKLAAWSTQFRDHRGNRRSLVLSLFVVCDLLALMTFFHATQNAIAAIFSAYFLVTLCFVCRTIYRQRFVRDFAEHYGLRLQQAMAISNFATRGSPLISPLVILFVSSEDLGVYLFFMAVLNISSFSMFFFLSRGCERSLVRSASDGPEKLREITAHSDWANWHAAHLGLMNLSLGGLFFLVSAHYAQTQGAAFTQLLDSPVPLYIGFWGMMSAIAFSWVRNEPSLDRGLRWVVAMSLLVLFGVFSEGLTRAAELFVFGCVFAYVVNQITTCVHAQFSRAEFSLAETRAQSHGRLAHIATVTLLGVLFDHGFSFRALEFLVGVLGLLSGCFLLSYQRRLNLV